MSTSITTPNPPSIFKITAQKIKQQVSAFGSKLATVEAYQEICASIQSMASSVKRVTEHYDPKIASARIPYKELLDEKKEVLDTIEEAQSIANRLKYEYEQEDERKRLAEERRLEAIENKRIQEEAKQLAADLKEAGDKQGAKEVLAEAKVTT